ncbi:MAG: hypothetical protein F7C37_00720 [Desulfurococcales archaeon]|nr:hypothetical protein [Desulfurococcales archaeon]MCE4621839.1 hypothetical protein [Desulfurococcales archaeon]MCE4626683.1 hypothetical protein [Desulfurococcales archaeon]NOZ30467.1 hypothetical protein [Thermoproteota archaeon]
MVEIEHEEERHEEESPKKKWVTNMVKSAKKYHKLCPYYDKKTGQCLLMVTVEGKPGRCDRDGRFDGCPVFIKFLEKMYEYYTSRRKVLPRDFQDVVNQAYLMGPI